MTGGAASSVDWTQSIKLNKKQVGIFTVVDESGRSESSPGSIYSILQQAVSNSDIGDFQAVGISSTVDDPSVAPDSSLLPNADYALTSEIIYDDGRSETQLYLYLYDNKTGVLVLSDQMVYQTLNEANEFVPFVVDSLLDRIEKYDITVTVVGNGTVRINGLTIQDLSGTSYARWTGAEAVSLDTDFDPYPRERFRLETIAYLDASGNQREEENTQAGKTLNLNSTTYALGGATGADPFNTVHPLSITANFSANHDPPVGSNAYQKQFSLNLSYNLSYLIASGGGEYDNGFYPLGGELGFDWMPFRGGWGKVGFGLSGTYNFLHKPVAMDRNYSSEAHTVKMYFRSFYEAAEKSLFVPRFGLGFGAEWMSPQIKKYIISGSEEPEQVEIPRKEGPWKASAIAFADFNLYFADWIYLRLGFTGGINFPWTFEKISSVYVGFYGGIGFRF
jgi:hypothetical protein